jgi:non-ribosomal peptide synthetase component E (peptide arylation enzyme)
MRISDLPLAASRMAEFTAAGYWRDTTSNDALEHFARVAPDKIAIIDPRVRLTFRDYESRAKRLASYFVQIGLTSDDVIAIQLPNWSEFPVALSAAMLVGIPFCQFHSDFRHREVEFVLRFTEASAIIIPKEFRRFNHVDMIADLRAKLPNLKHVLVVGDDVFDRPGRLAHAPADAECAAAYGLHVGDDRRSESRPAHSQYVKLHVLGPQPRPAHH